MSTTRTELHHVKGFALPTVIFFLVVLGLLLGYMSKLAMQQNAEVSLASLSARADLAARSALEWATYQIKMNPVCPTSPPSIDNHVITVACTRTTFQEGTTAVVDNRYKFDLVVSAESASGVKTSPDYAYRSLKVTVMVDQ